MKNELAVYVEPETLGEEGSPIEMKLYAELAALKSTPEEIDKPADERLMSSVNKAKEEAAPAVQSIPQAQTVAVTSAGTRSSRSSGVVARGFTITDFILLLIAVLLFLNIVTK